MKMIVRVVKFNFEGLNDLARPLLFRTFSKSCWPLCSNVNQTSDFPERDDEDEPYKSNLQSRHGQENQNTESRKHSEAIKGFFRPQPEVLSRSQEEIDKFRKQHEIKLKGEECPPPVFSFDECNFPDYITKQMKSEGFVEPTAIQSQGWPIALSGKNMVGIARTGSGKTLAYMLPSIVHIRNQDVNVRKGDGPMALVMAPTRELAQQIHSVAHSYRHCLSSTCVFGGGPRYSQGVSLRRAVELVIATPGRLIDFLRERATNLQRCSYVVLDEADRMLDMGFEPQIREIMDQVPEDRQILMWSATWPKEIRNLANDYLSKYVHLTVGSEELFANPNIKQVVEICTPYEKREKILEHLQQIKSEGDSKVLIFTRTKREADELSNVLMRNNFRALATHGDKSQAARDNVLAGFRTGRRNILVATDVAARGLDIDDIKYVINYDMPDTIDTYIHRIGRTARHTKEGTSISFITDEDVSVARELIEILEQANQEVPSDLRDFARQNPKTRAPDLKRNMRNNRNNMFANDGNRQGNRYGDRYGDRYGGFNKQGNRYGARKPYGFTHQRRQQSVFDEDDDEDDEERGRYRR